MKKYIALILILTLAFGISVVSAEGLDVTLNGATGMNNTLVDVRVILSGSNALSGLELFLQYDSESLLLYDIKDEGSAVTNHGYDEEKGKYCLSFEEAENKESVILTFLIKECATEEAYLIKINGDEIEEKTATILVLGSDPKDINEDDEIEISDSLSIVKHISGWSDFESISKGDVTGDGIINLFDALILAKSISGEEGYKLGSEREEILSVSPIVCDFQTK